MLAPAAAGDHEGLVLNVPLEAGRRRRRTRAEQGQKRQTDKESAVGFFCFFYIVKAMIGERKRDRQTGSPTEDWLMK